MNKILAVTVMTQLLGCATFATMGQYHTQRVVVAPDVAEESVLAAAERNARQQGWDVVMVDSIIPSNTRRQWDSTVR